jgi:hypothetical protein
MFLVFTVPLTLLALNGLALLVSNGLYQLIWGFKRPGVTAASVWLRHMLLTGLCQAGFVLLVLLADIAIRLSFDQNEFALQILLLSSFVIPPVILLCRHRQLSTPN